MNDTSANPFANPERDPSERPPDSLHPSDDPGREYPSGEPQEGQRRQSSGISGPSEPRRPGSGERQAPRRASPSPLAESVHMIPGEILWAEQNVEINVGLDITTIRVQNTADRPIQVGSHFHFAEVNAGLQFDREAAWGKRLNVLSGGSARFEPGSAEEVELVPIRGQRIVAGLRGLCGGKLDA